MSLMDAPGPSRIIRDATESDIEGILRLEIRWVKEDITINPSQPASREDLQEHSILIVAIEGECLVGYACADLRAGDGTDKEVAINEKFLEIGDMYVLAEFRSRGIGGALLEALIDRGKRAGMNKVLLTAVNKDMERLLKFYASQGFRKCPNYESLSWEGRMIRET